MLNLNKVHQNRATVVEANRRTIPFNFLPSPQGTSEDPQIKSENHGSREFSGLFPSAILWLELTEATVFLH